MLFNPQLNRIPSSVYFLKTHAFINIFVISRILLNKSSKMKVKMLSRNPDNYMRDTKLDIHKGELRLLENRF